MYTDFYHFAGQPFQLTPDPHFYFDSSAHRKAMTYLGYGLAQGEGFIVITGEIGSGKTTIVSHLAETIDRSRLTLGRIVTTHVDGGELLRLVAQAFAIDASGLDRAEILTRIEAFLRTESRAGKRVLLVVDEVQTLSVEALDALRMLSNFQDAERSLIQIFLLGQPEFRDKLASPELEQLSQRVIATHHLDPVAPGEVASYLSHRLALVGWDHDPRFDAGAIAAFYRHTGGIPRRLNTLAHRVLLAGGVEQRHTIDASFVDAVAADLARDSGEDQVQPAAARGRRGALGAVAPDATLTRRVGELEHRLEQNEEALRRVLTLLVDWVERDNSPVANVARDNAA